MEILVGLRKKYMRWVRDITDPGYHILSQKTLLLSQQEAQFVEIYENTFALHSLSIISTIPGTIFFYHFIRTIKATPVDPQKLKWAKRGMLAFAPLSMAFVLTAWSYEKYHGFEGRLKEIQEFYLSHKEQDINTISYTLQNLPNV